MVPRMKMTMVMNVYALTMRRLRMIEPTKLGHDFFRVLVSEMQETCDSPEERHESDEGENTGGDDEGPPVLVCNGIYDFLVLVVCVFLDLVEFVQVNN